MFLNAQCSFCFQPHAHLSLVIKGTIEATVVEVHAHIGLLIHIVRRILSVRIKKIRLTPRTMTQYVDAERPRLSRRGPTVLLRMQSEPLAGRGQAGGDG